MIKTIYFDLGGTLFKQMDLFSFVASHLGFDNSSVVSLSLRNAVLSKYRRKDLPFAKIQLILAQELMSRSKEFDVELSFKKVFTLYEEFFLSESQLFEESKQILKYLSTKGIRINAITDADHDIIVRLLSKKQIYHYFHHVISSYTVRAYKPSPILAEYALAFCSKGPGDVMYVGNSLVDVALAKRMNATSVAITRDCRDPYSSCDFVLDSLSGLIPVLALLS